MGKFERAVPKNVQELKEHMTRLVENRSHVKGVKVNPTTGHIEIDLDWAANLGGYPDLYMPVKKGKKTVAELLVARMASDISQGYMPSDGQVLELFDLIDPQGR